MVLMKEGDIQREITKMLIKSPDIAFYTVNTTGKVMYRKFWITIGKWFSSQYKNDHDGLSDITGMKIDGTYFAIEVKAEGKEPTIDQWNFINHVNEHGGLAGYATSVKAAEEIIRGFQIRL